MRILYVAGPYSSPSGYQRQKNIQESWDMARQLWTVPGIAAISPNSNTSNMDGPEIAYEKFLEGDFEMICRVDGLVMSPRWRESAGATREQALAVRLGLPVFFWPVDPKEVPKFLFMIQDWAASPYQPRTIKIP